MQENKDAPNKTVQELQAEAASIGYVPSKQSRFLNAAVGIAALQAIGVTATAQATSQGGSTRVNRIDQLIPQSSGRNGRYAGRKLKQQKGGIKGRTVKKPQVIAFPATVRVVSRDDGQGKNLTVAKADDLLNAVISATALSLQHGEGVRITAVDSQGVEVLKIELGSFENGSNNSIYEAFGLGDAN